MGADPKEAPIDTLAMLLFALIAALPPTLTALAALLAVIWRANQNDTKTDGAASAAAAARDQARAAADVGARTAAVVDVIHTATNGERERLLAELAAARRELEAALRAAHKEKS